MRADEKRDLAVSHPLEELRAGDSSASRRAIGSTLRGLARELLAAAPGDEPDRDREVLVVADERFEVLLGEDLRRRHVCDLERPGLLTSGARGDRGVGRSGRDHRLAAPDVAFDEPGHRVCAAHIGGNLRDRTPLRPSRRQRERREERLRAGRRIREAKGRRVIVLAALLRLRDLQHEYLLEREALARRLRVRELLGPMHEDE